MARKTTRALQAGDTAVKKAAAKRSAARKSTRSSASAAVKKSTEIKPRRIAGAVQQLKSPKVFVPLAVAVGLGIAAVRKIVGVASGRGPRALPRLARDISPRFSQAVHALADLGREVRSKIR
jgi:hypothetical protein